MKHLASARIGPRPIRKALAALASPRHYRAAWNMVRTCPDWPSFLISYLTARGKYPRTVRVKTPIGVQPVPLAHWHDALTLNEIFFRHDYPTNDAPPRIVVDIGSNVGLSALWFLTRGPHVRCICYEPVPANLARLRALLTGFADRVDIYPTAVGDTRGEVTFGVESTGRYGGIGLDLPGQLVVSCEHIGDVLREVIARHGQVDILKLDTEGHEARTIAAIPPELLPKVGAIYAEEAREGRPPAGFVLALREGIMSHYRPVPTVAR